MTPLLKQGDDFYVAITFNDYVENRHLPKYGLTKNYVEGLTLTPRASGSVTKANIKGKFARAIPERKTVERKLIDYIRKTDGTHISYMRDFNVYVKELQHKYNITFRFVTNESGRKLIVSPPLLFDDANKVKNTHVINLFLEVFGEFEIYNAKLEPALPFNKKYDFEILPSGQLNREDVEYLVEGARRFTKNENEVKAFKERLDYIMDFKPSLRGKGSKGFDGYIVFGFPDKGLAVIESMYSANATYVFDLSDYEEYISQKKIDLIKSRNVKKRIFHYDNWKQSIEELLKAA